MTIVGRRRGSRLASLFAPVTLVVGAFAHADAQWTSRFDVGSVARRELPAEATAFPARIGGSVELSGALGTMSLSGETISGFRRAERSDVTMAARLRSASWPWPLGLRVELDGSSSGTRLAEGVRRDRAELGGGVETSLLGVTARALARHASFERGAVTPHAQTTELEIARAFARGVIRVGGRTVGYPDAFVALRETTYVVAGFPYHSAVERVESARRRYGEAAGSVEWWLYGIRLAAHGGFRFASDGVDAEHWGSIGMELPLVRQLSLVADLGLHGSTPEQRLPAYRFGALSLRVRRTARTVAVPHETRGADASPSTVEPSLTIVRFDDGRRSLVLRGIVGKRVELMGDFSDWRPVELMLVSPGVWRYDVSLSPGLYHIVMRVDEGPWRPPPGLVVVSDDLELTAGLLVVP